MDKFSRLITQWYRLNKRSLPWRNTKDPYKIWLSEIILQQTRVGQGLGYYNKFVKNYPTFNDLANSTEQQILNDWQGLGYYSRGRNLKIAAQQIIDEHNGEFPKTYDKIIQLKGVGDYTASAISSFAFKEANAVVDGNVYRVLSRYFGIKTPIDSTQGKKEFKAIAQELLDKIEPDTHNQAIMELGATICSPKKPKCTECPISESCISNNGKNYQNYPVKAKKIKTRNRYFHFLIYTENNDTFIEKRTGKGIWENLYQFPLIELNSSEERIRSSENKTKESTTIIHKLSHQKLHCVFHHFNEFPKHIEKNWVKIKVSSIQDYPLPRVIDKYLNQN